MFKDRFITRCVLFQSWGSLYSWLWQVWNHPTHKLQGPHCLVTVWVLSLLTTSWSPADWYWYESRCRRSTPVDRFLGCHCWSVWQRDTQKQTLTHKPWTSSNERLYCRCVCAPFNLSCSEVWQHHCTITCNFTLLTRVWLGNRYISKYIKGFSFTQKST